MVEAYLTAKTEMASHFRATTAWKAAKPFWGNLPVVRVDEGSATSYRERRAHCKPITVRNELAVIRAAANGPSSRSLLDELRRACLANDPQATRQALDAWARQQPDTLADMAARFVPLSDALDGLNGALYSESGHSWQGEDLWRAIRALPTTEQAPAGAVDNGGLPPLYPR